MGSWEHHPYEQPIPPISFAFRVTLGIYAELPARAVLGVRLGRGDHRGLLTSISNVFVYNFCMDSGYSRCSCQPECSTNEMIQHAKTQRVKLQLSSLRGSPHMS